MRQLLKNMTREEIWFSKLDIISSLIKIWLADSGLYQLKEKISQFSYKKIGQKWKYAVVSKILLETSLDFI